METAKNLTGTVNQTIAAKKPSDGTGMQLKEETGNTSLVAQLESKEKN